MALRKTKFLLCAARVTGLCEVCQHTHIHTNFFHFSLIISLKVGSHCWFSQGPRRKVIEDGTCSKCRVRWKKKIFLKLPPRPHNRTKIEC